MSDERVLLETIESLLGELRGRGAPVTLTSDLEEDLGLGSLERSELLARIEQRFNVTFSDGMLVEATTPRALLDAVLVARPRQPSRTVRTSAPPLEAVPRARARVSDEDAVARFETLIDVARYRAEVEGDRTHLNVLVNDDTVHQISFRELWTRSQRVAAGLAALGVEPGDRVAIILPTCADFFPTFLGTMCAGAVAVPIYPPVRLDQLAGYIDRHARILRNAAPRAIVTDEQIVRVAGLLRDRVPGVAHVVLASALNAGGSVSQARVAPGDLALLQYTSGSTGDPKGVALRHRNVVANVRAIGQSIELKSIDVGVSWLPLYHDMGLMGLWWTGLMFGVNLAILPPLHFLSRPERWLWAIHRYGGSISPAPNFAYDLCVTRVRDEDIQGLDLSTWRCAMNGAEPVRPETLERFCRRFAPHGFRREFMMPVYGLAETAVAIAFPPHGRGPRLDHVSRERFFREGRATGVGDGDGEAALSFVSSGRALGGHEIRVVDRDSSDGAPLPERLEGRILVRGPSTMQGYYARPDETRTVQRGDWLDTGDLGYLADGELFVTGRVKDLVIKGGRNYHPQDIEQAAQRVEGIRKGSVVAFSVPDEQTGEAIVVVAETRAAGAARDRLVRDVTSAVLADVGTPADRVLLVLPGTLPKTSSGKLRRAESRARFLADALARSSPDPWWKLAGLAVVSVRARLRAAARRLGERLYGAYAAGVSIAVFALGSVTALVAAPTEGALRTVVRRWLQIGFGLTGLTPKRLGPPLPRQGVVLVSNHSSYLDSLVLTVACEQPLTMTIKAQMLDWPVIGRICARLGFIALRRTLRGGSLEGLHELEKAIDAGRLLHVFPEGTFTPATGVRPFRLGAFLLAARKGIPVVPVVIRGTRKALRDGTWLPRRSRIEVEVLPALDPPAAGDLRALARMRDEIRETLACAAGEPLLEIASAGLPPEAQQELVDRVAG